MATTISSYTTTSTTLLLLLIALFVFGNNLAELFYFDVSHRVYDYDHNHTCLLTVEPMIPVPVSVSVRSIKKQKKYNIENTFSSRWTELHTESCRYL